MIDASFVSEIVTRARPQPATVRLHDGRSVVALPQADGTWRVEPSMTPEAMPTVLTLHTLSGIIDLAASLKGELIAQVISPSDVALIGPIEGVFKQRAYYALAQRPEGGFQFNTWLDHEKFLIGLQAQFDITEDRDALVEAVASIRTGVVRESTDDGYAQQVTVKDGVQLVANKLMRTRWTLAPFRTFSEIKQPESGFILRLRSGGDDEDARPSLLLAECDGGAWRLAAIKSIAEWLRTKLPKAVTVVA